MFIALIIGYHASLGTKFYKIDEIGINNHVFCKRNCQFISWLIRLKTSILFFQNIISALNCIKRNRQRCVNAKCLITWMKFQVESVWINVHETWKQLLQNFKKFISFYAYWPIRIRNFTPCSYPILEITIFPLGYTENKEKNEAHSES